MSRFNYAREKEKFDREWAILEKEYAQAGMSKDDIAKMKDYDWNTFKRRRSWATYETPFSEILPDANGEGDVNIEAPTISENFLAEDIYQTLTTDFRLRWLNEIADLALLEHLLQLSERDLTILTLYAFEGKSQREIAALYGYSQQNLSQRMARIKKFLKNF